MNLPNTMLSLKWLIGIAFLSTFIQNVKSSVDCYRCFSNTSGVCGSQFNPEASEKIICDGPSALCSTREIQYPYGSMVTRGCVTTSKVCDNPEFVMCYTCKENLCNGSSYKEISLICSILSISLLTYFI